MTDLPDVAAPTSSRYVVVAAKVPGVCIVRCQALSYPPHDWDEMADLVRQVVGSLDPSIEWSRHDYGALPSYAHDPDRPRPPIGVFRYDYIRGDVYSREGQRVDVAWPCHWIRPEEGGR